MNAELWGILAGVVLTFGTGLFVAAEFALVGLDRPDLEQRHTRGERRLGPTIRALRRTSTHLSSAQLGITLTTLLAGYTFEPAISSLLHDPLTAWNVPTGAVPAVGAVVAITLATLFSMIFGELVPKNFALAVPLTTAKLVVPFQIAFTGVFQPVVTLLNGTANRVIRSFGIEPKEELSAARTAEELGFLIRRSATEGVLDHDDATILRRTLTFSARTAAELMTPRVRLVTLPATATAADVITTSAATGHSRFPIRGDDIDDIVGVVHVKSAYAVDFDLRDHVRVTEFLSEPWRVPESTDVGTLLTVLRSRGYQIAVVAEEHGGTAGIVTLEDVVEELLGELHDEHDEHTADLVADPDSIVFNGWLRPDELQERTGVQVPEGDQYDTVAGFMLDRLGHIPRPGEDVPLEHGVLRVERLSGVRVERIRYSPGVPVSDPETGTATPGPNRLAAAQDDGGVQR